MADEGLRESPDGQDEQPSESEIEDGRKDVLPKINCPEKIILCFDITSELNSVLPWKNTERLFQTLQRSFELFIRHKISMSWKHSIAFLTFEEDNALWLQDFTNDINLTSDTLHHISPSSSDPRKTFDMTSLFETVEKYVELPRVENVDIPPEYVVRLILICGSSHCDPPSFSPEGRQIFDKHMGCPYFFFDVLYVHETPSEDNNCEDMYDAFCKLDEKEDCFMLEVSSSHRQRLIEHVAKLLAHPLQRPMQQDIYYQLVRKESSAEEGEPE